MVLGAQLYTVRMYIQTEKDLDFTLHKISEIGYKMVQVSGISPSIRPEVVRELCDKYAISIVVTHSDVNRVLYDTEKLIEEHNIMGSNYIGIGSMPEKYRTPEWVEHFKLDFKEPIKKIKDSGKLFMYHNHDFEFEKMDGVYYLDYIADAFKPDELGFTLDTYWIHAAGCDVCDWINKLKDRIPCVHLKDMAMFHHKQVMAPVLDGNMNFKRILESLAKSNCEYLLVEQDTCQESPFVCLEKSYRNLNMLGYE